MAALRASIITYLSAAEEPVVHAATTSHRPRHSRSRMPEAALPPCDLGIPTTVDRSRGRHTASRGGPPPFSGSDRFGGSAAPRSGAIGRQPTVLDQHLRGRPSERGPAGSRPARPSADGTQRGMQDEAWASGKQLTRKRSRYPPNRDNHTPRPGLARSPRPGQGRRPPMRGRHDTRRLAPVRLTAGVPPRAEPALPARLRCHPESCSRPSCMSATGHCSLSGCRPVDSSPPLRSTTRRWWRTGTPPCAPRIPSGGSGSGLCSTSSLAGEADRASAAGQAARAGTNTPGAGGR